MTTIPSPTIPAGLCQCGCGQPTTIAPYDAPRSRVLQGQPYRYVRGHQHGSLEARFWRKVAMTESCWLWTGSTTRGGYGILTHGGKARGAHRISWVLHHGPIPDDLFVCHDCDKLRPVGDTSYRRCVNPAHLFLGTSKDNTHDMMAKGRKGTGGQHRNPARGERKGSAKITEDAVHAIRQRYAQGGVSYAVIAQDYGLNRKSICDIVRHKKWSHVLP